MAYGSSTSPNRRFHRPREVPPLRQSPTQPDAQDNERCAYLKSLWHEQDDLLRGRDRQIEENIRMLLGQQWLVWSDLQSRYIDLAETLSDDERRWRHMPVLNRLFLWYVLLHARMTENPPTMSWLPGPDRIDALLAEVADPVHKYIWRDVGMLEVIDRLMSYLIPSGRAYLASRIDPTRGDPIVAKGPAMLQLLQGSGAPVKGQDGQPIQRYVESAAYGADGNPVSKLYERDGGELELVQGDPYVFNEGGIDVDVLAAPEVRGEWGPGPWHKKAYHIRRIICTPMQAYETWGVDLEPDVRGDQSDSLGLLWRILQGSGHFGAADGARRGSTGPAQEFCTIYEGWFRPSRLPGMAETPESPGGRLLAVTGSGKVIRDGARPARFRYGSPIRCFDFVNLPGRPSGTSPQEMLNGPVRTRNRFVGQLFGHATLSANPTKVVDKGAGLQEGDLTNIPGEEVFVDRSRVGNSPVIEYVQPPHLGPEVGESIDRLRAEVDQIGSIAGTEGEAPTIDASGELVKELRFNSDRPISSTLKRAVGEFARLAEDFMAWIPMIWDQEKILRVVGEDGIARVITVLPHLFEQGSVNVEPQPESMLPEGRGERQTRVWQMWQAGAYGDPLSMPAINAFLDQARFPHMAQATRPGGSDRSMAEQNVGKLLQGVPSAEIPVFEWYDHAIHRWVLERFMKSPEYLKLEQAMQLEFYLHRQNIIEAAALAAAQEAQRQMAVDATLAGAAVEAGAPIQKRAEKLGVAQPPDTGATGRGGPSPSSQAVA